MNPLEPSISLLAKLGSIALHTEEAMESQHPFDVVALRALLSDGDVKTWMEEMRKLALLPEKR